MVSVCEGNGVAGLLSGFWRCARGRPGAARLSALLGTCPSNAMVERKGREGREEILVFFAAFAAFAFNRGVRYLSREPVLRRSHANLSTT